MASESHNPFRRRLGTTSPSNNTTPNHPASPNATSSASPSNFARALSSLGSSTNNLPPPPAVTFAKPKPVKKVRVQSPPPSSPESAGAEHPYPKYPLPPRDDDYESSEEDYGLRRNGGGGGGSGGGSAAPENPFANEAPPLPEGAFAGVPLERLEPVLQQTSAWRRGSGGPPPNPFQKTLKDMERAANDSGGPDAGSGGHAASSSPPPPPGRSGMDVEAFKRLLLTGQGPAPSPGGDNGSMMTETSSVSRQSMLENTQLQETPRTSHETEPDDEKRTLLPNQLTSAPQRSGSGSRRKKPPPPPATRHGKLIKVELADKTNRSLDPDGRPTVGFAGPASPLSDLHKPLPAPPDDEAAKNIFDKEAAGKLPAEADDVDWPPTPPNVHHAASTPVQSPGPGPGPPWKPLPPPRRGQGRSNSTAGLPTNDRSVPADESTTPPRSSIESTRSRSSSIRVNMAAGPNPPVPPPPRRGTGGQQRQSPSWPSPSVSTSATASPASPFPTSPDEAPAAAAAAAPTAVAKHPTPPVPPPQRTHSLRKSASAASNRSSSGGGAKNGGAIPPPPPPPPPRGASKDGGLVGQRGVGTVVEKAQAQGQGAGAGVDAAAGDDAVRAMLADLDALQREVDAARAQAEAEGAG